MSSYQEKVLQVASQILPDWPKKPTQFYVAILPYNVTVPTCQHADFFWLKCGGRTTIATLRKAYIAQSETSVELMYEDRVKPQDDTQIRNLYHTRSDILVFWTIVNTTEVLSLDVHPNFWAIANRMQAIWAGRASPRDFLDLEPQVMPAIVLPREVARVQREKLIQVSSQHQQNNELGTHGKPGERQINKSTSDGVFEKLQQHVSKIHPLAKIIMRSQPGASRSDFISAQFGCQVCGYFNTEPPGRKALSQTYKDFEKHFTSTTHRLKSIAWAKQKVNEATARNVHGILEYLRTLFKSAQLEAKLNTGPQGLVPRYTIECLKCRSFAYQFFENTPSEVESAYRQHRKTRIHQNGDMPARK
ncbi:hypothetical protein HYALB_00011394 [Hymenoscyphus albidus]|uniref:Uncharacterized protein n=1 Tax=Hymenoscyphus albidus TaxID=595503 RepID=A0A9N9LGC5_9HELO|nr:hypothetical protein HYALB_00011394 [Hymenoscyphus albidus]